MSVPPAMSLSRRVSRVGALRLARLLRLAGETGATDIALGIPTGGPPPPVLAAASAALHSGANQYAEPEGLPTLRRTVAGLLRATRTSEVDPDTEVTITAGATEGVYLALLTVTDPGDEVIVFEPYFELYPGMIHLAGATPVPVPLRRPGWRVHEPAIRAALSPRTRAILVNTPHNPTGRVFDATELRCILDICAEFGLMCITDEVYEHFVFDGRRHISPRELPGGPAHTIVVSSLSKTLEITGWRLGFCVAAPAVTRGLRTAHEHVTLGASRPLQAGAAALPVNTLATTLAARRRRFARQRDRMVARLRLLGFDVQAPEGSWFLLAGTEPLGRSATALATELVTEAGVLLAPGDAFFADPADGDRWLRATFVRDPAATAGALDRLATHLAQRHAGGQVPMFRS